MLFLVWGTIRRFSSSLFIEGRAKSLVAFFSPLGRFNLFREGGATKYLIVGRGATSSGFFILCRGGVPFGRFSLFIGGAISSFVLLYRGGAKCGFFFFTDRGAIRRFPPLLSFSPSFLLFPSFLPQSVYIYRGLSY